MMKSVKPLGEQERGRTLRQQLLSIFLAFAVLFTLVLVGGKNFQGDSQIPPGVKPPKKVQEQKPKSKKKAAPKPPAYQDCKPKRQRCVYLTFDDGPWPGSDRFYTYLAKRKIPATFFVVGQNLKKFPRETKALKRSRQRVAVHSWAHVSLPTLSEAALRSDLRRSKQAIRVHLGQKPRCYRPPYGATNGRVRAAGRELGLREKLWDVDSNDWRRQGTQQMVREVMGTVKPGAVILLHDGGGNRDQSLAALKILVPKLEAKGYSFGRLC